MKSLCHELAGPSVTGCGRRSLRKAFSGAKIAQVSRPAVLNSVQRQQRLACSAVAELSAAELRGERLL